MKVLLFLALISLTISFLLGVFENNKRQVLSVEVIIRMEESLNLLKTKTIMRASQIKEELYDYIEKADARLLKMLYAIAKEYTCEDYTLPGESMSEETLINRIRAAKSRIMAGQFTTQEDLEKEMEEW